MIKLYFKSKAVEEYIFRYENYIRYSTCYFSPEQFCERIDIINYYLQMYNNFAKNHHKILILRDKMRICYRFCREVYSHI